MSKPMKRPFATHYYSGAGDTEASFTSQGAAASEEGAIRATVVRVFVGQWAKAVIHDRRTGVALYNIATGAQGIRVRYGSGVTQKQFQQDTTIF